MTFGEAFELPKDTPVFLKDGMFGLVIRWFPPDELGIQVPGEENIRSVNVKNVSDMGDGALIENDNSGNLPNSE